MKLFVAYVGGETATSNIELHDVRFSVGASIEDCHDDLRWQWWGTKESLHLDCWGALEHADGFNIRLHPVPQTPAPGLQLYFANLGGYDPAVFGELHKNAFIVAPSPAKARIRALKMIRDWKSHHEDFLYEIEKRSA